MCDERYQLPHAVHFHMVGADLQADLNAVSFVGYMGKVMFNPPVVESFNPSLAGKTASEFHFSPNTYETLTALHRLADELSRLTMGMPDERQKPVRATYYELHRIVTGG